MGGIIKKGILAGKTPMAILGFAISASLTSCSLFGNEHKPMHERLTQVRSVAYDEKTCMLTWDKVEHANLYVVNINGNSKKSKQVETNYCAFMPTQNFSAISIQAVDTSGEYDPSKWSDALTYQISESSITIQRVFSFVNSLDQASDLVSIARMYIEDDKFRFACHVVEDGKDRTIDYKAGFESPINSLTEALNTNAKGLGLPSWGDFANFDSAKYFLESNEYAGQMEEYRQKGYQFEVVSSAVRDCGVDYLTIYGTYRLTKDGDIKYIEASNDFAIFNPSTIQRTNYTSRLKDPKERYASELTFHELTGGFYDWAKMTYESNQAQEAFLASQN